MLVLIGLFKAKSDETKEEHNKLKRALNSVLPGDAPPEGPNPYPFIYHFDRKGTPFIENFIPFKYLGWDFNETERSSSLAKHFI